jgi:hypothetical protein
MTIKIAFVLIGNSFWNDCIVILALMIIVYNLFTGAGKTSWQPPPAFSQM